jgi:hypothetical protein
MATNAPSILRHDAPATVVIAVRCCGSAPGSNVVVPQVFLLSNIATTA